MKKFTLIALSALAFAGAANAQLRWNPENSWGTWADNEMKTFPLGEDGKSVVNTLGAGDGQYRQDMRYAGEANFIEEEPYLVVQITTENCAWNLNDFKFEFMIQRKYTDGFNEEGNVVWGPSTDSYDPNYPSFDGDKYKVVDQYEADLYRLLGSRIHDGNTDVYNEDVIVIDLNKVRSTKDANGEYQQGLLFSAGDVYMPNYNNFVDIKKWDADGQGGVQQRSWFGFVCIAKNETVTGTPTFTVHYTGTVEDSSDALTVCENYANSNGGKEVRDGEEDEEDNTGNGDNEGDNNGEEEDPDAAVDSVAADALKVYLKNGKTVVAPSAQSIVAYSVDGKKVGSAVNELELPQGIYIVKAKGNGVENTVKVVVR